MERRRPTLPSLLYLVLAIFTSPYRRTFKLYTWQPLRQIRAANGDRNILIPLVKDWKLDKYNELQSVQVTATFCSAAALSCLPLSRTEESIWAAEALWYTSLLFSISAVVTSIQAKSILDDLPLLKELNLSLSEIEVQHMQRTILRYRKTPGIKYWAMVFIWQYPSMTMSYAWLAFLAGLTIYVCTPFIRGMPWQDRSKIAIVYLAIGSVGLAGYIFSTSFVYASEKDLEHTAASTRTNSYSTPHVDLNDLESAVPRNRLNIQTKAEASHTDLGAEEQAVQITPAKGFVEPEQEEENRQGLFEFARSRKRLLY